MGKGTGKVGGGGRGTQGAYAKNHKRYVRALVDYDYLGQLDATAKKWLAKFTDEFYGGKFVGEHLHAAPARKQIRREKNPREQDAYARAEGVGELRLLGQAKNLSPGPDAIDDDLDLSASPSYLESDSYKNALENYRAQLPLTARNKRDKNQDPKYIKALARLNTTKKQG